MSRNFGQRRNISQTELAKFVGVTPSTISQVEGNLIYPSVPALIKIAEMLGVDVGHLIHGRPRKRRRAVFSFGEASTAKFLGLHHDGISGWLLLTPETESRYEPYLLEIGPEVKLPSHFFFHKGSELGHLLSGRLKLRIAESDYVMETGDTVLLASEIPTLWENLGSEVAKLLWVKLR